MKNRKKMIIKATIISSVSFILQGILTIIRTGFIVKEYGSNINGVISLSQQVFHYLALLESGLGAAYLYKMYEPMAKKKYKEVKGLYLGLSKTLKKIAISMFIVMLLISIFYPFIMNRESLSYITIFIILLLLGIRFILPYYFIISQKNLLYIYEEKYIVDLIDGLSNSAILILEIILIKFFKVNIVFVLTIGIIGVFIVYLIYKKMLEKRCKSVLSKNSNPSFEGNSMTKDIVVHQVSSVVFNSTDNIVLSIFSTLTNVTIYSSYNTILTYPVSLINKIVDNLRATFGKKMVESEKKTIELFYETLSLLFFAVMVMAPLFYILINEFIQLWIGKEYILNSACLIIWTLLFIHRIIIPIIYVLRDSKGLYKESKYYTLFQAIANLVISLLLVKEYGIFGLLLGTVISTYLILVPANYNLVSKKILKTKNYLLLFLSIIIIYVGLMIKIFNYINNIMFTNFVLNWSNFIIKVIIDGIIASIIAFIILIIFNKSFRKLLNRFIPKKKI